MLQLYVVLYIHGLKVLMLLLKTIVYLINIYFHKKSISLL